MITSFVSVVYRRLLPASFCAVLLLAGCEKHEEIANYTVASHESLQTPEYREMVAKRKPAPARMLAAIIPEGGVLWFFKFQGPPDLVAEHETEFRDLLKSVQFKRKGTPTWTLPPNWKEQPGNEMRFATLVLPQAPLEVTVTKLPAGGDLTEAILANINRWRNQLDLPFIQADDLKSRAETIERDGLTITLINIVGKARPTAAMPAMPPMANPAAAKPAAAKAPEPPATEEPGEIKYQKPAEWTQVPPKMFTIAAFEATDGSQKVVISLSRAGGSKVANVNRWRGQLGLPPEEEGAILKSLEKVSLGKRTGELVTLQNKGQTMFALMIPNGEQTVFVKLVGDDELAAKERGRFDAFAQSLKF